jgi:4-amino-4-deoxychorismate lyase
MSYWYLGQWSNTETLPIAYDDPGLLYGATVFTTCRVYEKSLHHPLTLWSAHRARLTNSLLSLGWTLPTWEQVEAGISAVLQHSPDRPIIRVTIFPDGRELPADLAQRQQQGIVAKVVQGIDHQSQNQQLPSCLAGQTAGCPRCRRSHFSGCRWLETSAGNLWGWDGENFYTLAIDSLAGIARSYLVECLQSQDRMVDEQPWDL